MGTVSRVHTFSSGAILTAAQLNNEFDNLLTSSAINGGLDATNLGVTAGQATASKALVVDSSRNLADGTAGNRINNLALSGTFESTGLITATAGITSGSNIVSDTDSTDDLGTTGVRWRNLYVDDVTVTNNVSIGGTLTLTGGLTLNGNVAIGDSASDTLTVNSTITSNLIFTDATYDIGASGATRPRDLHLSRNALIGGTLGVTGLITANGGLNSNNVAITGGSISGITDIAVADGGTGASTASAARTNLGLGTIATQDANNVTITGGSVTGMGAIGGTTGTFSSTLAVTGLITANGGVSGNISGNVTGNISGNVTGGTISGSTGTFSGDVAVATNVFFVDVSGSAVGIGTNSLNAYNSAHRALELGTRGANIAGRTDSDTIYVNANSYQHTDGNWKYDSTDEASQYYQTGGTHNWRRAASGTAGTNITWTTALTINSSSETVFTPSSSSGNLAVKVGSINSDSIRLEAGGTTSTYLEYRGYLGHSWYVDSTRSMTLDSTGLGIGVDSPTSGYKLDIADSGSANVYIRTTASSATASSLAIEGYQPNSTSAYVARIEAKNRNGSVALTQIDSETKSVYNSGALVFKTASTGTMAERARITSDGMGVLCSPSAPLAVASKASSYEGMELVTPSGDGSGVFQFGVHQSGSTAGRGIEFRRGGSDGFDTLSLAIDADGNLKLQNTSTDSNPFFQIKNDAREYNLQVAGARSDNFEIYDNTAGTQRLTILSDGKTGIGTASPRCVLNLDGNESTAVTFGIDNTSGGGTLDISCLGATYTAHGAAPGEVWFYSPDNINIGGATSNTNDIKFLGGGNEKARIRTSGGITFNGDTADANALDDYEEGTHVVTIGCSTSGTLGLNSGRNTVQYTKVGDLVLIQGFLEVNSVSSGVGYVTLSMPYANHNQTQFSGITVGKVILNMSSGPLNCDQYVLYMSNGASELRIYATDSGLLQSDVAEHITTNGGADIFINFSYRTT